MLEYIPAVVAAGALLLLLVAPWHGWERTLLLAFLVASIIAPWPLVLISDSTHYGIATPELIPTTYGVTVLALAVVSISKAGIRIPWSWYILSMLSFSALWMLFVWETSPNQWSGIAHLLLATLVLSAATSIGARSRTDASLERTLVIAATLLIVILLALVVAQLAGLNLSIYSELEYFIREGRPLGSFNHPTTLGKIVAILQIVLLTAASGTDRGLRRWAWAGLLAGIPATALTQSRANSIALVAGIVIWLLLTHGSAFSLGRRLSLFIVLGAIAIPAVSIALERFAVDADGGDRAHLLSVGLSQIASNPWAGTGPNNYVEVVGARDEITAAGFPVHVSPLLSVAELGVIGGALFWLPVLVVLIRALRSLRGDSLARGAAVAYIATFPGLMLIAFTGWGMLAASTLGIWWFAIGYAAGRMSRDRQPAHRTRRASSTSFSTPLSP